jgi:hypothetical protein
VVGIALNRSIIVIAIVGSVASWGCGSNNASSNDGGASGHDGSGGKGAAGASGHDGTAGIGGTGGGGGLGSGGTNVTGSGGVGGPDAGVDTVRDGGVDLIADAGTGEIPEASGPPSPPTGLAVSVLDRRQTSFKLSWVAPATSWGGPVSTYQVRYSTLAITAGNFDTATVASTFAYAGAPAAVGKPDGVIVKGLNIETDYYFAVASVDAWGNRSEVVATSAAAKATFLLTILSGAGTDNSGYDLDGSADLGTATTRAFAPDGLSDLIVGATAARHVYVYFGTSGGYSATPSITITGSVDGFGTGVADAGDLDGDGLDDIAIASPADSGGKVFIFSRKSPPASWGTATSWPTALTDTQANYVISSTGALSGAMFHRSLARLGDFDGAGGDDLAIGYAMVNSNQGVVAIVKGGASFASRTLPDTTNAIEINGTVAGGGFGVSTVGIGRFFGASAGTTLVSTASIAGTSYAFGGQSPAGGVLTAANADDSTVGVGADRYGTPIAFLGPLGASPGAFALAAVIGKYVDLHLGTAATGPFVGTAGVAPAASVHFVDSAPGNSFGVVSIGSGIRGTSKVFSIVGGDALPDLVLAGQGELSRPLYIVSGAALTSMSGTVDVATTLPGNVPAIVKVANKFPADWSAGYTIGCSVPDSNGDGYGDFAIGESVAAMAGRVVVFF